MGEWEGIWELSITANQLFYKAETSRKHNIFLKRVISKWKELIYIFKEENKSSLGKEFLEMTPKAQSINEKKKNNFSFSKSKTFALSNNCQD